jgi:hypothetical protein
VRFCASDGRDPRIRLPEGDIIKVDDAPLIISADSAVLISLLAFTCRRMISCDSAIELLLNRLLGSMLL